MSVYCRDELTKIIERYGDSVYRLAYLNLKKKELADDIYQDVFLRLIRQKKRVEPEEHLKAWLLRTTINCCKDYWKSKWFQSIVYDVPPGETSNSLHEDGGEVIQAVQSLPEKYRNAIHLYYFEEYSIKEIAKLTGQSENTVSSQLARGRKRLKDILCEKEMGVYE